MTEKIIDAHCSHNTGNQITNYTYRSRTTLINKIKLAYIRHNPVLPFKPIKLLKALISIITIFIPYQPSTKCSDRNTQLSNYNLTNANST